MGTDREQLPKGLFALGFQGFLIMICVGIYAVLVNDMVIADNLHSAIFSLAAYTVILCFSLFKLAHLQSQFLMHISGVSRAGVEILRSKIQPDF